MHEPAASVLKAWESFYVIVGSSSGALTGLQFVVMTLIGEATAASGRKESISAFGSPNVVHFCAGLLLASILSAPWGALVYAGVAVAACGASGVVYSAIVQRRALRQKAYQPVFEDWLWHTILPMLAYSALLVAGLLLQRNSADALFVIGAAMLLLVFIGIHNAWDTVTYVTLQRGMEAMARADAGGARDSRPGSSPASGAGSSGDPHGSSASRTPGPSSDLGE
jgi:hypothetical protein